MLPNSLYKTDIEINYGNLKPMLSWCESNCVNEWSYEVVETAGQRAGVYRFYFNEEKDYVNFTLWKK